ncbi:MAG: hypothetical protein GY696_39340 [Gammaproteobacteria bacterium]|nr:hypothetical protein [Gammaproteobacteria bacterium]
MSTEKNRRERADVCAVVRALLPRVANDVVAERGYGRSSGKLNQLRERKMNLREAKAERKAAQGPPPGSD